MAAVPPVYMGEGHANIGCDDAHPISVTPALFLLTTTTTTTITSPITFPFKPPLLVTVLLPESHRCASRSAVPGEPPHTHPMLTQLFVSGLVAAAAAQTTNSSSQACVSGNAVHMIVARASLEPPGFGVLQNISTRVIEQLPGSNAEAVVYPATLDGYQGSEGQGVTAMTQLVNNYAQACPNSKMVLMGYSQGAQVTADTVCGSNINGFAQTQAISTAVTEKVAAIMLMGDPTHLVNQPFDEGTSTKNGVFPRTDSSGCAPVASKMVSFCNAGDTFCDSGNNLTVHLSYVQDNGTSAVNFITQKVKGGSGSSNSSGSTSGTGSGTGTVTTNAASRVVAAPAGFAILAGAARMLAV